MNKQYRGSRLPYSFADLKNETAYTCSGSKCTCKYLNNRSQYDKNQFLMYQNPNISIDYQKEMFKPFKIKNVGF